MRVHRCYVFFLAILSFPLPATTSSPSYSIEEVVVTLDFRPQSQRDVVVSNTVLTNSDIENNNAQHIEDVLNLAINVQAVKAGGRAKFFQIRGIGETEQFVAPIANPSVAVFIDGIDFSDSAIAANTLGAEQVEVFRGIQPLNYGGVALAGAIHIRSPDISNNNSGKVRLGLTKDNGLNASIEGSQVITDKQALQYAVGTEKRNGYISNDFLNRDDTGGIDEQILKIGYLAKLNDNNIQLRLFNYDIDNGYDHFSLDNNYRTLSNQPGQDSENGTAYSLQWEYKGYSNWDIAAFFALRRSNSLYQYDEDWCNAEVCSAGYESFDSYDRERENTQIQVTANHEKFLLGTYRYVKNASLLRNSDYTSDFEITYQSFFAQWRPSYQKWLFLLGLRRDEFADYFKDTSSPSVVTNSSDIYLSQQYAAHYKIADNQSSFISINVGHKPGGVNSEAIADQDQVEQMFGDFLKNGRLRYETETVQNFEIGYGLRNRYSNLKVQYFYNERQRAQIESSFVDSNFNFVGYIDNAKSAENSGLELSYNLNMDSFRLQFELGYLHTQISGLEVIDTSNSQITSLEGRRQSNAPHWTSALQLSYQLNNDWQWYISQTSRSNYYYAVYHQQKDSGNNVWNSSLQYRRNSLNLTFWMRNITDRVVVVKGFYFGNDPRVDYVPKVYTQLGEPRTFGITAGYQF